MKRKSSKKETFLTSTQRVEKVQKLLNQRNLPPVVVEDDPLVMYLAAPDGDDYGIVYAGIVIEGVLDLDEMTNDRGRIFTTPDHWSISPVDLIYRGFDSGRNHDLFVKITDMNNDVSRRVKELGFCWVLNAVVTKEE